MAIPAHPLSDGQQMDTSDKIPNYDKATCSWAEGIAGMKK
jgi:hypothetical protein